MKPATPLPWKVGGVAPGRYPFYPIASGEHNVAQVDIHARGGSNTDAAFIVHAANAYPKLIDALKDSIATTPPESSFFEARVALLRELGEETPEPALWQRLNALSHRFAFDGPEARALTEAAQIVKSLGES